jgi:RNA polymerase sigma factor (sigma-70 family)
LPFLKSIPSDLSDEELVQRYKASGDMQFLANLYERYLDLIYGVCLQYLKQPENAQDSTLSLFEELKDKLLKYEVQLFRPWLHTVVKNHCLMRIRSEKKMPLVNSDVDFMQSEDNLHLNGVLEKEETFKKLEFCLRQLGSEQRTVIELFYLEGKCYTQIAEQTGIDWNRVRSFIQNGRRNLRICMEKQKQKGLVSS